MEISRGVIAKVLDFGLEVSQFELQVRYYGHFHFEKGMNLLPITPAMD